ncbi:MAG TPA: penicillin-binding transpeptidase domain-containing protein [Candidatus Sulfopaludibacter sp.]|jgi:cell division protein FtsI/penicillin-binding protein 2|nr:penicillin-binding transpeptidase domain-containing protein [Candidatus Sulfopaludibacter sp.]
MKRFLLPLLVLAGMLQNVHLADAQASRTVKKTTPVKKKTVRRVTPPIVDPTVGDNVDGEDLAIRRAAVDALGMQPGSVVVVDPNSGRVLTMVNQRLALKSGFIPCSTIKLVTALAALSEHVVERDTTIHLSRYASFNLTNAIAHSNNPYFGVLGTRLGFDRVTHYAQMFGLGEKAGLDIAGEEPGTIPAGPPRAGGMGLMTAYGEGFQVTPLELASLVSAIANNGTLYYLQYPRSADEIEHLQPKVKRSLDLAPSIIPDLKFGMRGAVDYGTATRANYDPAESIFGKTGTCTDFRAGSHMGWFGSFIEEGPRQLVVVVMLTSPNKSVSGPVASGVAGAFYRNLSAQRYFASTIGAPKKSDLPEIIVTSPGGPR